MKNYFNLRWQLVIYDAFILILVDLLLLALSEVNLSVAATVAQVAVFFICIFAMRLIGNVYRQIWRYGGIQCYIKLVTVDAAAFLIMLVLESILFAEQLSFAILLAIASMNLLGALTMRMYYRYAFKCGNDTTLQGRILTQSGVGKKKQRRTGTPVRETGTGTQPTKI